MCLVSLAVKKSFMATSLSVCVDYMQYILSYCSCFCPLSSLCSISSVGERRGEGLEGKWGGVYGMIDIPPKNNSSLSLLLLLFVLLPLSAVLVKPVEVRGISCSVAFAKSKKKKKSLQSPPFLSLLPFCLCKTFWSCFLILLYLSLCYCFLLLCSLIQTSLSHCLFSQRWKDSLTSSKVYGAMFLPLRNSGNQSFLLLLDN